MSPINSNSFNFLAPVNGTTPANESDSSVRQIVTAIRGLNKSEFLGQGRELTFRQDPQTKHPIIEIIDSESGDVIDQLPPEAVLQMAAQFAQNSKGE